MSTNRFFMERFLRKDIKCTKRKRKFYKENMLVGHL